jgi:para-nitrobenzyl esterase
MRSQESQSIELDAPCGRLRGLQIGSVAVFKGIPYAAPPVGDFRFRSPQPLKPWAGARDALEFGPAAVQTVQTSFVPWVYTVPETMDEDCLTLNAWSPDTKASLPVIVWIHGGGYRTGASSMPVFDGIHYAETGKVVFVTINYRLGVLGWAAHPALRDPETGAFANWAIQDQLQALGWVQENIGAFGGNPTRVTVMGQSGGAINAIMMAHEVANPPFHQLIAMSPPYICPPATLDIDGWRAVIDDLAEGFGTSVEELRGVPATALHEAELRQFHGRKVKTDTGRAYRGTVVDGIVLKEWPAYYALPKMPMIIGSIRTEASTRFNLYDPISDKMMTPPPPEDAAIEGELRGFLGSLYELGPDKPVPDAVIEHYREAIQAGDQKAEMPTVAKELLSDASGRHYALRKAQQAAAAGARIHFYEYGLPLLPPNQEPGHATELSIVFGTYMHPYYRPKVGDGPLQKAVSRAIIDSFTEFAATGTPKSELLPRWPAFTPSGEDVMIFGEAGKAGEVAPMPKMAQLTVLDELAALRP